MSRFTLSCCIGILIGQLALPPAYADSHPGAAGESYTVRKDEPTFKTGSVFVSSNKKNDVLVKTSVWGAVQFPGVHYIPLGTRFLDALSYAGGPLESANTDQVSVSTKPVAGVTTDPTIRQLSVQAALGSERNNPVLQADDIIVVKEDKSDSRLMTYLAVGTFLLSAAALGLAISRR